MKTTAHNTNQKGFTLIELLVVIGILAVLLAITLIAINPARQFQQARDTQRSSDVNAILNAVHQYMADTENNGQPPATIPTEDADPLTDDSEEIGLDTANGMIDLCDLVPDYIAAIPTDPQSGNDPIDEAACTAGGTTGTDYNIVQTGANRITVSAPSAEGANPISVTR